MNEFCRHIFYTLKKPSKAISSKNGPSAHLISCINHLGNLLRYLPENLPLDPLITAYSFSLDAEQVSEEGVWFAFNNFFKVSFQTHAIPENGTIVFHEQGKFFLALISLFKEAFKKLTKDIVWEFLQEVWFKRLIRAVELQGAKILAKWVYHQ